MFNLVNSCKRCQHACLLHMMHMKGEISSKERNLCVIFVFGPQFISSSSMKLNLKDVWRRIAPLCIFTLFHLSHLLTRVQ